MTPDNSQYDNSLTGQSADISVDRREVRIHCRLTVEYRLGSLNDYGVCWNLGLHGMYIASDGEAFQGETVEIGFILSDEYPSLIEASGRVIWANTGSARSDENLPEGFGIEFQEISDIDLSLIAKFIAGS